VVYSEWPVTLSTLQGVEKVGDAYIIDWSHDILTDSRRWHLGGSNFYIAFWIRVLLLIVVCGIDDICRVNLPNWEDFLTLPSGGVTVVSFEFKFIASHRCANDMN